MMTTDQKWATFTQAEQQTIMNCFPCTIAPQMSGYIYEALVKLLWDMKQARQIQSGPG